MAFRATYEYDEYGVLRSWGIGEGSAGWFGGSIWGDVFSVEGMFPQGGTSVPVVISEEPQTWEELEEEMPELFEPILETRPGRVADSYPQDVPDTVTPEDEVATTWGDWFFETATGVIGDFINPQPDVVGMGMTPNIMGPSTPANQQATAAAMATGDCDGMTWAGGAPPKGYKVVRDSCGNGVLRKVRRRRRRRMLSASDKSDIAAIVSMVGKGQMASALINRSTN